VRDIALYFPYVNLPGDSWVKAAALHWPQLGRIRPRGNYGLRDSDTVKRLRDELDFIVDVRPGWGRESWWTTTSWRRWTVRTAGRVAAGAPGIRSTRCSSTSSTGTRTS
jgi:hypothetical protein